MHLNQHKTALLVHKEGDTTTLHFRDGSLVPTTPHIKYLGSMVSWKHPLEISFYHRRGLSEEAYKKLRPVWNNTMTFLPVLTYGLDAITITEKQGMRRRGRYNDCVWKDVEHR